MRCARCGSENADERRFCGECGAPLPRPCLDCGFLNEAGAKFCGGCGRPLAGTGAAPGMAGPIPQPPVRRPSPGHRREAERRQLTVLFCDLVGSTALAAELDPEDLREVIGGYHRCVAEVVERFEGHVAKYLGDGVLAYFGYPRAHEDDAERAVRAGLALVEAVGRLAPRPGLALQVRVGIATGLVVVGDLFGEGSAREETAVGETPNLAARLQALADPRAVVIAPGTRRLLGGLFDLEDLGAHDLKGFAAPVQAWRVLGPSRAESRFEARQAANLTPLVGREEELALLLRRWEQAAEGEGQVVLLAGEPGIGKSRLLRALRERLEGEPHTPLSHYCSPYHKNSALHPVIGLLERAAGLAREDPPERRLDKLEALLALAAEDVREVAPLLADLLGIPTGARYPPLDHLGPQRKKEQTLQALVDQLAGLAARQPVLALWEDAHWIDPTSLELLGLVVDRVQRLPVLAVITFRPEFRPPWTGHGHVTALSLGRLSRRQGGAMIERMTAGKPLPEEVVEQIIAKTDGVPLFVEELTRTVLESGLLTDVGDRDELAGGLPPSAPLAIPATLRDSLMARLDRLARGKEVAQIAAVMGREFSHELLAAVADRPEPRLSSALDQLVAAGLIFRRGLPPEATYSFKHALIQEAAYHSLLRSRRRELHRRIADVLETSRGAVVGEDQPELLAHHFTEAGLYETAVDYWTKAGQNAFERFATAEAVAHLSRGLGLIERLPENDDRDRRELHLLVSLGPPLMASRGITAREVGEVYARAHALCDRLCETRYLATVLQGLRVFHGTRGELDTSRGAGQALLELARRSDDRDYRLEAHRGLAVTCYYLGDFIGSRHHSERGIGLYDAERHRTHAFQYDADPGVTLHAYAGWALHALGFPDQALRQNELALAVAQASSHPYSVVEATAWRTQLALMRRDPEETLHFAEATLRQATDHRFPLHAAFSTVRRGWALAVQGDGERGIAVMGQGLAAAADVGARVSLPQYHTMLGEALGGLGQVTQALALVDQAMELIGQTNSRAWEAEAYRIKGDLLLRLDGPKTSAVEATYRRAIEIAAAQRAKTWELRATTNLARLWAEQGERRQAHDLLAPIYGWFTEGFDTADLREAKALFDELA